MEKLCSKPPETDALQSDDYWPWDKLSLAYRPQAELHMHPNDATQATPICKQLARFQLYEYCKNPVSRGAQPKSVLINVATTSLTPISELRHRLTTVCNLFNAVAMGFLRPWYYDSFCDSPLRSLTAELRHLRSPESSSSSPSTVQPSYKYRSSSSGLTLQVELPGVRREHATVQVEGRTLVIKGKRFRREPGSCTLTEKVREECEVGHTDPVVELKYYLALKLSERVDRENVKADCCGDGLLVVNVPYKEKEVKKITLGS